jgi:hypothetical protein
LYYIGEESDDEELELPEYVVCDGCSEKIVKHSREHSYMNGTCNKRLWFCKECCIDGRAKHVAENVYCTEMCYDNPEEANSACILQRAWRCYVAKPEPAKCECSHTNTVSWGNRFGSGINCYDCGFSLDKNRTVIPGSNMVNCSECGESVDRVCFGLFDYGGSENWYCKRVCSICETVFKCGDEYDEDDLNVYCTEMCYDYFQENDAECDEP